MWCEESLTGFHRSHLCLDLFWVVHFGCFVFPLDKIYIWHGSLCMALGNCWLCVCTGTSLAIDADFCFHSQPFLCWLTSSRVRINMHSSSGWLRKNWGGGAYIGILRNIHFLLRAYDILCAAKQTTGLCWKVPALICRKPPSGWPESHIHLLCQDGLLPLFVSIATTSMA